MGKLSRSRLAVVLAVASTLASSGAITAILATSGGNGHASALTASDRRTPADLATPADVTPSRPVLAPPSRARFARMSSARAAKVAAEKPTPVVGGVRRANVGSAHSPEIARQLSRLPTTPPPAGAGALGVDVADYQHPHGAAINWPQVAAAGYKFAFIKATEGDYYSNPYYAADLAQAKEAGLNVAGYHFAVPNISGASQADYAVRESGYTGNGHTLPLALDIEYNPYGAECYGLSHARMVSWVSAFATEVRHLTGQRPVIYTTADWWHTCTGGSTSFASDPLWVAGYGNASPPMPAGWANWTFWQFTSQGSVPGITGHVDVSYFLRSAARLLPTDSQQAMVTPKRPSSAPGPTSTPAPSPIYSATPSPSHSVPPTPRPPSSSPTSPSPSPTSPSPSPAAPSSPSPSLTESPPPETTPSGSVTGTAPASG